MQEPVAMEEFLVRFANNMIERVSGPMHFRLLMQPFMATVFAVIAGRADAKAGKTPYFWGLLSDPAHRRDMLKDGWKDVGKVFTLAILLDVVYQFIVEKFVYPLEAITVAFLLAIVPYLLVRGLVTRITRRS
jgi:hypothetical protein